MHPDQAPAPPAPRGGDFQAWLGVRSALARAQSIAAVGRIVAEDVARFLGTARAGLVVPAGDGEHLLFVAQSGLADGASEALPVVPLAAELPLAEAFRKGEPVFVQSREELRARFPRDREVDPAGRTHALACLPLLAAGGGVAGVIGLGFAAEHEFGADERSLLAELAVHAAAGLERGRLLDGEERSRRRHRVLAEAHREARDRAEAAAERAERLQRVTAALSRALTVEDVGEAAVEQAIAASGALAGAVAHFAGDGLRSLALRGYDSGSTGRFRSSHLAGPSPLADAVTERRELFFADRAALLAAYPKLAAVIAAAPEGPSVALPLETPRGVQGALGLRFPACRAPDGAGLEHLRAIAFQAAIALERAWLGEQERAAARRQRVLLEASRALAEAGTALDRVLGTIVHRVAEDLGDAALVVLSSADGARLDCVACHARDPDRAEDLRRTLAAAPFQPGVGVTGGVARSGRSLLAAVFPGSDVEASVLPAHRELFRRQPVESLVSVPLRAGGEVIGALTVMRGTPGDPFTPADQGLLESLGVRAALAIRSARQHEELASERQRLADLAEAARAASRAKDEFMAMLGHELRNPLSPILTALHLMKLRGGDALLRERTIVERQVHHLVRLVDDLLDVSRITGGKVKLERRRIALDEVVAKAVEMASPLLEDRAHRLTLDVAPDLFVHADEHRLAQVVSNLLTNAAKYTPSGGEVALAARRAGGSAELAVRDSGIGIPPDLLPRVFDLFVQGDRGPDRHQGGLGLGLTIVKSLVELHGGEVSAASEGPGKGATFTVRLPTAAAEAVDAPAAPPEAPASLSSSLRVLVVDDNADAAELLVEALRARGHEVAVAFDGPTGLEATWTFVPDIVLLDIGLPVMDGYEVARRVRDRLGPRTPGLVAITGYGQTVDRRRSAEAGFAEHLVKPALLEQVLRVIDSLGASRAGRGRA